MKTRLPWNTFSKGTKFYKFTLGNFKQLVGSFLCKNFLSIRPLLLLTLENGLWITDRVLHDTNNKKVLRVKKNEFVEILHTWQ